jgi:hypothetical protein
MITIYILLSSFHTLSIASYALLDPAYHRNRCRSFLFIDLTEQTSRMTALRLQTMYVKSRASLGDMGLN